jgi:hypothetical protein
MSALFIMFYACLTMAVITTATYGILAPWYDSRIGKHLMGLLSSLCLSFGFMAASQIPGVDRAVIWFSAFGIVFLALFGLWLAILHAQGKTTRHIADELRTGELPKIEKTEPE